MTRHVRGDDTRELAPVTLPPAAQAGWRDSAQWARPPRRPFWPRTWQDAMYMAGAFAWLALACLLAAAAYVVMGH